MRILRTLLLFLLLLSSFSIHAQSKDGGKLDLDSIAERSRMMRLRTDSLNRVSDSLFEIRNREETKRSIEQMSRNTEAFVRQMKEREQKEQRRSYIRFGIMAIIIGILIYTSIRRRRKK